MEHEENDESETSIAVRIVAAGLIYVVGLSALCLLFYSNARGV